MMSGLRHKGEHGMRLILVHDPWGLCVDNIGLCQACETVKSWDGIYLFSVKLLGPIIKY